MMIVAGIVFFSGAWCIGEGYWLLLALIYLLYSMVLYMIDNGSLFNRLFLREKKWHWYNFTYQGYSRVDGSEHIVSRWFGLKHKRISKAVIMYNKRKAGVTEDAVLISSFYLGKMTQDGFRNGILLVEPDQKTRSEISIEKYK